MLVNYVRLAVVVMLITLGMLAKARGYEEWIIFGTAWVACIIFALSFERKNG